MPPPPQAAPEGATVFSKLKMGATMGGAVGLTIGFLFGSFAILKYVHPVPGHADSQGRRRTPGIPPLPLRLHALFRRDVCLLHVQYVPRGVYRADGAVGSVIRTDGLSMAEWAQREVAQGRMGVLHSAGGNGGSVVALAREWERRKGERS